MDTVKAVMKMSIDYARGKLEERLRELPDGVWREVQYIDHDGHGTDIYQIVCTLRKKGQRLEFDFEDQPERQGSDQFDLLGVAGGGAVGGLHQSVLGYSLESGRPRLSRHSLHRGNGEPLRLSGAVRHGDDFRRHRHDRRLLALSVATAAGERALPGTGDGSVVGNFHGTDLRRNEPARLCLCGDRDEPLRRRRRRPHLRRRRRYRWHRLQHHAQYAEY